MEIVQSGPESGAFGRRLFMSGVLGVAGALAADRLSLEFMRDSLTTEVAVLDEHKHYESDSLWVIIPGLGVQSGLGIASVLRPTLERMAPVSYLQFADEGVSLPDISQKIELLRRERGVTKLHIYAHSMGGTTMLNLLPGLSRDIELQTIILDSSPFTEMDVRRDALGAMITGNLPRGYRGGLLSKLGMEGWNNMVAHKNNDLSLQQQWRETVRIARTGVSSKVWLDQMYLLDHTDPKEFRAYIPPAVHAAFCTSMDENADKTVYAPHAAQEWNDSIFDGRLHMLWLPNTGHANPTDRPREYNDGIYNWLFPPPPIPRNIPGRMTAI